MAVHAQDHHGTYYHEKELRKHETGREQHRRKQIQESQSLQPDGARGHPSSPVSPQTPACAMLQRSKTKEERELRFTRQRLEHT